MAEYIDECLESIFHQSLRDIEVLFCDDGSMDCTESILERYMEKYRNITYIRQDNKGPGIARNRMLAMAKGEYIAFIDADDKYPNCMCLEMIYEKAKSNNAMVCGGNIIQNDNGKIIAQYSAGDGDIMHTKEGFIKSVDYDYMYGHTRYLFRTDFVKKHGICFAEYKRFEDQVFTIKAIGIAKRLYECDVTIYEYRINHKRDIYDEDMYFDMLCGFRDTIRMMCHYNMRKMYLKSIRQFTDAFLPQLVKYSYILDIPKWNEIIQNINLLGTQSGWASKEDLINEEKMISFIQYISNERKKLERTWNSTKKVVIYGAGNNTKLFLEENPEWKERIAGIAVSDYVKKEESIFHIDIKCIEEYMACKNHIQLLITPKAGYRDEIIKRCNELGFMNYEWIDVRCFCGFIKRMTLSNCI